MATYIVVHPNFGVGSAAVTATVERGLSAAGPWTLIGTVKLVNDTPSPDGGEGFFYDNTAPFDTPVWYRVTETTGSVQILGPFTLASNGTVVLSDPLRPWADIEFSFCATPQMVTDALCAPEGPAFVWVRFGNRTRAADAGLFSVLDAEHPADIYARRKDHSGTERFFTRTLAAAEQIYELFTAGGPLFLRAPAEYGDTNFYLQPGDLSEAFLTDRIDQRKPLRVWDFPYVVVDGPLGVQQGPDCANWCAVKDGFPTFAALTATGDTWRDVASGETLCPAGEMDGFGFGPFGGGPFGDGG